MPAIEEQVSELIVGSSGSIRRRQEIVIAGKEKKLLPRFLIGKR
jgi:hypothetical protein